MSHLADAEPRVRGDSLLSIVPAILLAATLIRPHFAPVALMALAVMALVVSARHVGESLSPSTHGPAALLATAFCAFAALSAVWSLGPGHSLAVAATTFATLVGALALPQLFNRMPAACRQRLLFGALAGYTIGAGLMAIEFIADFPITRTVVTFAPQLVEEWRGTAYIEVINGEIVVRTGLFSRTMFAVSVLLFPVLYQAHTQTSGRRRQIYFYGPILCALIIAPLADKTAALVALGAGLLVCLLSLKSLRWGYGSLVAGWIAAALLILPLCLVAGRFAIDTNDEASRHVSSRLQIWSRIGDAYLEHPLFGIGADATRIAEKKRVSELRARRPDTSDVDHPDLRYIARRHPHNSFLQIWHELGLAGAALLFAAGLASLAGMRRLPERAKPFAYAGTTVAIVYLSVAHSLWQPWFAATLALAFIVFRLAGEDIEGT